MDQTWEMLPQPLSPGPSDYANICPSIMLRKSHLEVNRLFSLLLFSKDICKVPIGVMVRKHLLVCRVGLFSIVYCCANILF